MGNVIPLNLSGILDYMAQIGPFQAILYDAGTGGIRWANKPARSAFCGRSERLQDVLHREEAEAWMLEGRLVLKSGHTMEYVEHVAIAGEELVSSRSGAWEALEKPPDSKQLAYVQVGPASVRKELVMRIIMPLDRVLQLAEEYMVEQAQNIGVATLSGK